jgi:hypothetical protein
MAAGARKNPVLANPFFVALMVVSTLFVVTALGYSVVPYALERVAHAPPDRASQSLANWLDRQGPTILGVEFSLMLVTGVLAMFTDDWFSRT